MAAASIKTDIAIVGAGIIGLAVAFRLAAAGRDVVVVDPNEPGSGASYGNAGAIAPLRLCADRQSRRAAQLARSSSRVGEPVRHRPAALPALLPWLSRFLWQSTPKQARRNGHALRSLLKEAMQAWRRSRRTGRCLGPVSQ